ncbi:MAG: hypothetical protein E6Q89_07240 [Bacteroidia bacterium]|nr:MAG: hypothetical protein E6Q89_07240 [Bacteroidia bacterium]
MNNIKKYIELLYNARNKTKREQLTIVRDISRRGFLKSIVDVTLFGMFYNVCCAVPNEYNNFLPDMGDSDRANLSQSDADFLGKQVILDIYKKREMLNDYDVLQYLNDIGTNLVSYSPMAGQDFNFYLMKAKDINAFALPGGYICVYNGLIDCVANEAELASVMSHEIGHIVQHHIFRNIGIYGRNQWLAIAGLIAGALMAAVNPGAAVLLASGGQGLAIQNILSFSRQFEREADRMGQKIMYNAGFDPHAMPNFFRRLADNEKFNSNDALAFLQTHPVTIERLSEAEERANQLTVKMRLDSISFLIMREKCRVRQLGATSAILFYTHAIKNKKYINLSCQQYGLAYALFLSTKLVVALATMNKIEDVSVNEHPAYYNLKAQIFAVMQNFAKSERQYLLGLDSYPSYKGLWLGRVDLYIKFKKYGKASKALDELTILYPNDSDLWLRMATVYADSALNIAQKYHYALGNQLYLQGLYELAMEHYKLAIEDKSIKVNGTNDELNSQIVAKIIDTADKIKNKSKYQNGSF